MKKSECVKKLCDHIDYKVSHLCGTTLGEILSSENTTHYVFHNWSVLTQLAQPDGSDLDQDAFFAKAQVTLKNYLKNFSLEIKYENLPLNFHLSLAEKWVDDLETFAKPRVFHKRKDQILKYDWAPETLSQEEVFSKLDKKFPGMFKKAKSSIQLTARLDQMDPVFEETVAKFMRKFPGWSTAHLEEENLFEVYAYA